MRSRPAARPLPVTKTAAISHEALVDDHAAPSVRNESQQGAVERASPGGSGACRSRVSLAVLQSHPGIVYACANPKILGNNATTAKCPDQVRREELSRSD